MAVKKRTRARHLALQFLYQVDLLGVDKLDDLTAFLQQEEPSAETRKFARRIVKGTLKAQDELDKTIQGVAQNWQIDRMAVIDRNVLRLAAYELLLCDDIPPNVAINEAIELGKRFSTANSGSFINGILDKIKKQLVADEGGDSIEQAAEGPAPDRSDSTPAARDVCEPASADSAACTLAAPVDSQAEDSPLTPEAPQTGVEDS